MKFPSHLNGVSNEPMAVTILSYGLSDHSYALAVLFQIHVTFFYVMSFRVMLMKVAT